MRTGLAFSGVWILTSSGSCGRLIFIPLWFFCPPGFLPLFSLRLLFLFGFLYPSLEGGLELLCESIFNCLRRSFMVSCSSMMVVVRRSFCRTIFSFCSCWALFCSLKVANISSNVLIRRFWEFNRANAVASSPTLWLKLAAISANLAFSSATSILKIPVLLYYTIIVALGFSWLFGLYFVH